MYRLTTTMMIIALGVSSRFAHAAPPPDVLFVDLHFADLDLTRSEGAAVLHRRIEGAAKTVCAPLEGRDVASQMRFRLCVQTAIGSAVAKVDRPALTAYHTALATGRHATIQIAKNQN